VTELKGVKKLTKLKTASLKKFYAFLKPRGLIDNRNDYFFVLAHSGEERKGPCFHTTTDDKFSFSFTNVQSLSKDKRGKKCNYTEGIERRCRHGNSPFYSLSIE
jgi:hypothetical protein